MRRCFYLICYLVPLVSCSEIVYRDPQLPEGAIPVTVLPSEFETWHAEVETCSGLRGDLSGIRWFYMPDTDYFYYDGVAYSGMWWENRWILLTEAHLTSSHVVRHEMLHDLVRRTDHPALYFEERCGALVWPDESVVTTPAN